MTKLVAVETPERSGPGSETPAGVEIVLVDAVIGLGVRALRGYSRGGVVGRMTGEVSASVSKHSLQITAVLHMVDRGFAGYLQHSCDPNCVLDVHRLEVVAIRDIQPGEWLTIDYAATEDVLHRQFGCACGASNCRRWITGRREAVAAHGASWLAVQS